ncbi:MAG: acyltransferase [Burkholderiaceae bacterium]
MDHLRAFACIWILFYHGLYIMGPALTSASELAAYSQATRNPLHALWTEGHTALALFMVLSGFIFTLGTFRKEVSYRDFIVNRILRIYPLYLCLLLLAVSKSPNGTPFLSFVTSLLPLADFKWTHGAPLVAMGWAISIEFQFYLIFPLLLGFLNRGPLIATVGAISGALAIRVLGLGMYGSPEEMSYWHLTGRIDQFVLGMFTATLLVNYRSRLQQHFPWLLAVALPLAVLVLWGYQALGRFGVDANWKIVWPTVEGLVWSLVILGYVGTRQLFPAVVSNAVCAIGTISYSVYLLHRPILEALSSRRYLLWHPTGAWETDVFVNTLVLALPVTLAMSFVTYRVIERPFLSLRRGYVSSGGTAPAT